MSCTPWQKSTEPTRAILSFLSAVSFKGKIKCLNNWHGDDVEVLVAANPLNDSGNNLLLQSILQLLGHPEDYKPPLKRAAQDIAVLIDTDNPNQDMQQCRQML